MPVRFRGPRAAPGETGLATEPILGRDNITVRTVMSTCWSFGILPWSGRLLGPGGGTKNPGTNPPDEPAFGLPMVEASVPSYPYQRCPPAARLWKGVSKGRNKRVLFQDRADHSALDTLAATVDDADFIDASLATLLDIFLYNAGDVPGRESMQVNIILYGEYNRLIKGRGFTRVVGKVS